MGRLFYRPIPDDTLSYRFSYRGGYRSGYRGSFRIGPTGANWRRRFDRLCTAGPTISTAEWRTSWRTEEDRPSTRVRRQNRKPFRNWIQRPPSEPAGCESLAVSSRLA